MTQQVVPDTTEADPEVATDQATSKVAPTVVKPTPLPWRELSVVLVIVISEGFASTFILPFIGYMVIGFGVAPANVGYYAGYVTSAFFIAQLFSSFVLGYVSDIKGRRPIMLLGLIGNSITSLIFGVSTNLAMAMTSRLLCGLINGNTGVVKSYMREITDDSNQARAYSVRSAGYAAGMIVGPFLGGVLARPAVLFPDQFDANGLFGRYPFLLPCLVSTVLNGIGVILGYFYLKETVNVKSDPVEETATPASPRKVSSASSNGDSEQQVSQSNEDVDVSLDVIEEGHPKKPQLESPRVRSMTLFQGLIYTAGQFWHAMKTRAVLVTMLLYAVLAAVWLGFDEVFAIWALQSVETGGLFFKEANIGTAHALSGVGMLILQLFVYPPLDKAVGSRRAFQITCSILAPVAILMPFTNFLAYNKSSTALLWICVGTLMALKSAMGTGAMAAINLMINNASDPELVGSINGLSASIAAFSRLIAPTLGGSGYAWSLNNGLPFPLDFHFVFLVLGLISLGMVVATEKYLDKSIDIRKKPPSTTTATPNRANNNTLPAPAPSQAASQT